MNNYGFKEQEVRDALPNAIDKVKGKLGNIEELSKQNSVIEQPVIQSPEITIPEYYSNDETNNGGRGNPMQRVLTNGAQPTNHEPIIEEKFNIFDGIAGSKGSSFVIIVAGVVTLVAVVSYITFQALSYIGG